MNCCLKIFLKFSADSFVREVDLVSPTGTCINGASYWNFEISGDFYQIRRNDQSGGCQWEFVLVNALSDPCNEPGQILAVFEEIDFDSKSCVECPLGTWISINKAVESFVIRDCDSCNFIQERDKRLFKSIRLPEVFEEEDRGFFRCCVPELVLADGSSDSWKNDVTSAWVKLSDVSDNVTFELKKDNVLTSYTPTINSFIKEPNAFYTTIQWKDVLNSDGPGCYKLEVSYNISGIIASFTWGVYQLNAFSIEKALETARVRVKLNSFQEIEGIDFTDSLVETSLRFNGFIGMRQPNTEIDNIIYENREMKRVIRENLNSFEIKTDPICEQFITQLTDLYLLSENELYISDYNAHNHSYKINDLAVIVEESPEINYFDYARDAVLTCKVGDKFKNKRTYYK